MDDARQLRLVIKAVLSGVTGCFEWESDRIQSRVHNDPGLATSVGQIDCAEIKRLVIQHITQGGRITQRAEQDDEWKGRRNFDYWYSVSFPVPEEGFDIFVKFVLVDDEEELPEAVIVGAHRSTK